MPSRRNQEGRIEQEAKRMREFRGEGSRKHKPGKHEPRRIGEVLVDLLAQRGYAQAKSADECVEAWQVVVGELARHTLPGALQRGVLQINVRNSTALQELTFRKQELLSGMRRALPHHQIVDLRFRIGYME